MNKEEKERHDEREETKWRAQVLRMVLKRIDNVMDWRFVNPMGEVVLDSDLLTESIDCDTLRAIRECVVYVLEELEAKEKRPFQVLCKFKKLI